MILLSNIRQSDPILTKKEPLVFKPTTLPHEKHEHNNYFKVTDLSGYYFKLKKE